MNAKNEPPHSRGANAPCAALQRIGIDLLEIFCEVGFGKCLDAIVSSLMPAKHSLQPKGVAQTLRDLVAGPVRTIERSAEILEELRSIVEHAGADLIEHFQSAGRLGSLLSSA